VGAPPVWYAAMIMAMGAFICYAWGGMEIIGTILVVIAGLLNTFVYTNRAEQDG
jgi:hypothetical protein